jgi:hypothetical protein
VVLCLCSVPFRRPRYFKAENGQQNANPNLPLLAFWRLVPLWQQCSTLVVRAGLPPSAILQSREWAAERKPNLPLLAFWRFGGQSPSGSAALSSFALGFPVGIKKRVGIGRRRLRRSRRSR